MKTQLIMIFLFVVLASVSSTPIMSPQKYYFYRTVWWPGCDCGTVDFETIYTNGYTAKNFGDCLKDFCQNQYPTPTPTPTWYAVTQWYPSCSCGQVNWESPFTSLESCQAAIPALKTSGSCPP